MKLIFKKYFVSILSILLILSNFSYAADLMMCGMMSENKIKCCCSEAANDGMTISKVKKSCCDSCRIELSNSTNPLNLKTEVPCDIKSCDITFQEFTQDVTQICILPNLFDKQKLPEDIPILTSSLLI